MSATGSPPPTGQDGTVLVGVDGSRASRAALAWAVDEARFRSAGVVAIMAWDYLGQPHLDGDEGFDPGFNQARAQAMLDDFVDGVLEELGAGDVHVERRAVLGLPAAVLVDASGDADVVVVGRRGLGGFRGLLLGSVSQQVVMHAQCPVVVHRSEAEGPG